MFGFDKVFDIDIGVDFIIMEEGIELINRIKNGGKFFFIIFCFLGWIKFCEYYFLEFLDNLFICKLLYEMFGVILKIYFV